jgi:hypothetical protein
MEGGGLLGSVRRQEMSEEITEYKYDWRKRQGLPPQAEMDRRKEEADIPTMEEVEESGLLPEHEPLSDIDYVTDEDHWPTALAVEVGSGHRMWYHFQYDEENEVELVNIC